MKSDEPIGRLLTDENDKPRTFTLHPFKSMIFWVNIDNPVKIERSLYDGSKRKTIVNDSLVPIDIYVDAQDDYLFWADTELAQIERSNLNGLERQILVKNETTLARAPAVFLAVYGDYLYW